jgi:hypothetical protein
MEKLERGKRDLAMPPPLVWLSHREVVRERHEGDPRRCDLSLHRERYRRNALALDGPAYQPHGPVAQRSRRCEQNNVYPVTGELFRDLGGCSLGQWSGAVYCSHEGEMTVVELSHSALGYELPEGPQREDTVEISAATVRGVVRMGPGEVVGVCRYLAIGAVAQGIVYVEAWLFGEVYAAGSDER